MEQFSLRKFVCQILVKLRFENAISSKGKPDFGLVYQPEIGFSFARDSIFKTQLAKDIIIIIVSPMECPK